MDRNDVLLFGGLFVGGYVAGTLVTLFGPFGIAACAVTAAAVLGISHWRAR